MNFLWIISLGILLAYTLRILSYRAGWKRVARTTGNAVRPCAPEGPLNPDKPGTAEDPGNPDTWPAISVVVPLRNEEKNIGSLVGDLGGQDYPAGRMEVILVDDHSGDRTLEAVRSCCGDQPGFRVLQLEPSETGKKAALEKGIRAAQNRIILNTDGDCRVPSGWARQLVSGFSEQGVRMVAGTVTLDPDRGIFRGMQSLESFSLTAVSGGSAGLRRPVLCSGASLAYFREDYMNFVGEHDKVSESGDDLFLMLWLKQHHHRPVGFAASEESVVKTVPAGDLRSFFRQRMRWVSKIPYFRDAGTLATAALVLVMNLLLLALLLAFLILSIPGISGNPGYGNGQSGNLALLFGILIAGKSLSDLMLLVPVLKHYGKSRLLLYFLPLQMIYFMYVSLTGALGQLPSISWKGRKVRTADGNRKVERGYQA
jgi:biofilm PGA synthesis N-glycosyltransferase PgaC